MVNSNTISMMVEGRHAHRNTYGISPEREVNRFKTWTFERFRA
jgi:hypothetical protein